jgi:Mg2+ and Co2+ transporter CorA
MIEGIKQISEENAKQSESMAIVAYETKRDSEVMKTITVVTMFYLPATFSCVRSRTH